MRFVEALAFQRDQADRQVRRVKLQDHWRQRSGRQAPQVRHRQIRNGAQVGVRVRSRLKINLDQAHSGQRPRLNVVHSAGQREEPFERIRNAGFDLLRRHSRIKCRNHHHRNIDRREQIYRHAYQRHRPYNRHNQATDDNEKWIANRKSGH